MKTLPILLALTGLITTSLTSQATIYTLGTSEVDPANGYTYYLTSPGSWTDCEAFAQTLGGNLVTIRDSAEDQWVSATFTTLATDLTGQSDPQLWIGFYDPVLNDGSGTQHAADFVWADGEPVTYTDWAPGEPSNSGNVEYYAQLRNPADGAPIASWNDVANSGETKASESFGVVEVVPEPQAYAFLFVCTVLFIAFRRKQLVTE
jgi:hypothetical protein